MSNLTQIEIQCIKCQLPIKPEVWTILNVKETPELKDLLVSGELNMVECKSCKARFYAENFFLYHDPEREILAFVYPRDHEKEKEKWTQKSESDFQNGLFSISYKPVTLFGVEEILEIIRKDEDFKLEEEVVQSLAKTHNFKVKKISPYKARLHQCPALLPVAQGSVLEGLKNLLSLNDRLSLYKKSYDHLKAKGNLSESLIKG